MDKLLEQKIIKAFVKKNFQHRLFYELSSNKRMRFIHKMCHSVTYFKGDCILQESNKNPPFSEIKQIMQEHDAVEMFYVISEYSDFDGLYIDLETAVERFSSNGFASFIVGLPSGFTHFKGESYASHQPNLYLRPQNRFDGKKW